MGDSIAISEGDGFIEVPRGYTSDQPLSGSATWIAQTFDSLGLTPGTYTYTWGTGGPAHTLTVEITAPGAELPEPPSAVLAAFAPAGLGVWVRRRAARRG